MGMGRNSSRLASRRLATSNKESYRLLPLEPFYSEKMLKKISPRGVILLYFTFEQGETILFPYVEFHFKTRFYFFFIMHTSK